MSLKDEAQNRVAAATLIVLTSTLAIVIATVIAQPMTTFV